MTANNFFLELHSYTFLEITGNETDRFLQGQLSINIDTPNKTTANLAALCNPKGRIVSLFHITKINNGYRLFMPKTIIEATLSHLRKYAVFFKVKIEQAASSITLFAFNSDLAGSLSELLVNQQTNRIIGLPNTELSIILASSDLREKIKLVINQHSADYLNTEDSWYWQLATHKIPWLNQDSTEQFLPHNLNLPQLGAVDFNKGCFTGQEIIARMQYKGKLKQHMQLLKSNDSLLVNPNESLEQTGKKIGEVICSINIEEKGCLVLALLKDSVSKNENIQLTSENSPILTPIE